MDSLITALDIFASRSRASPTHTTSSPKTALWSNQARFDSHELLIKHRSQFSLAPWRGSPLIGRSLDGPGVFSPPDQPIRRAATLQEDGIERTRSRSLRGRCRSSVARLFAPPPILVSDNGPSCKVNCRACACFHPSSAPRCLQLSSALLLVGRLT